MSAAGANPWDGATLTEPKKDGDGAYLIGTGAELAWFAKNGDKASAKLTADIELAAFDWTPMAKLYGTFDGQGHVINNLYVNSGSYLWACSATCSPAPPSRSWASPAT